MYMQKRYICRNLFTTWTHHQAALVSTSVDASFRIPIFQRDKIFLLLSTGFLRGSENSLDLVRLSQGTCRKTNQKDPRVSSIKSDQRLSSVDHLTVYSTLT